MNVNIKFHGKKKTLDLHRVGFFEKFSGLMFRSSNTRNLLFCFDYDGKWALHSWFVFFPFLVLWLDKNMNVIEWRIIRPFSTVILPKNKFRSLVELPLNNKNKKIIDFIVGRKRFIYGN